MAKRSKPETISARVTLSDKKIVEAEAAAAQQSVSEWLWERAVPVAREQLRARLQDHGAER